MRIDPNAGTRTVQETAASARIRPPGVSSPPRPAVADAREGANDVDRLFQVMAGFGQELRATFDGAEQRRASGMEGMDDQRLKKAVADARQNLQGLLDKTSTAGRSSRGFIEAVEQAISSGEASTAHLDKVVRSLQEDLAQQFGFSGHLLDRWA
jgi:hypothetical protein